MKIISTTEILAIRVLDIGLRKFYGLSIQECYSNWALTQLSEGLSSTHLYILAGVTFKDNFFEVDAFFLTALKELNIALPRQKTAIRDFAIDLCKKILKEQISMKEGCDKLASIAAETDDEDYIGWYNLVNNDYDCYLSEKESSDRFNQAVKREARYFLESSVRTNK